MSREQFDRIERKINRIGTITIVIAAVFFALLTFEAMSRSGSSFAHYAILFSFLVGVLVLILRRPFRG